MRKLLVFSTAVILLVFSACNKMQTTIELKNQTDSINYAFGVLNGANFKMMIDPKDTTKENITAMLKGFKNGFMNLSESVISKNEAITAGIHISDGIKNGFLFGDSAIVVNKELIYSTVDSILNGKTSVAGFTKETANQYFFKIYQQMRADTLHQKLSKEVIDSLNIAYGVMQSANLPVLKDSNRVEFIKNFNRGKLMTKSTQRYENLGLSMAANGYKMLSKNGLMGDSTITLNAKVLTVGINAGALKDTTIFSPEKANTYLRGIQESLRKAKMEKEYGAWRQQNEQFLTDNKAKDGIKTTESGLQYQVIKEGKGAKPAVTDRVKVNYKGTLIDGTVFDSSTEPRKLPTGEMSKPEPAIFGLNQVIRGWAEGLQLMSVGSTYKLFIPAELAYGDNGAGGMIKPFSTLIFDVDLLSIEQPVQKPQQPQPLVKK